MKTSLSGHQSSHMQSDTWLTPPSILKKLGRFDLDPCCPPDMPWKTANVMWSNKGGSHNVMYSDGLTTAWCGRVWLNPPFGNQAQKWLDRLAKHGNGIALIPARTETRWFFKCIWDLADAVLFVRGRPHFCFPDGTPSKINSGAPICLVAYGQNNVLKLNESGLGVVVDWSKQ